MVRTEDLHHIRGLQMIVWCSKLQVTTDQWTRSALHDRSSLKGAALVWISDRTQTHDVHCEILAFVCFHTRRTETPTSHLYFPFVIYEVTVQNFNVKDKTPKCSSLAGYIWSVCLPKENMIQQLNVSSNILLNVILGNSIGTRLNVWLKQPYLFGLSYQKV